MTDLKKLIGQDELKSQFEEFNRGFKKGMKVPPLLLKGAKGLGKTEFATAFAKELKNPFIEINCGTIGNVDRFFEQIYMPAIMDRDVTILFDEAHKLPAGLANVFLTVFNSGKHKRKSVEVGESRYEFDFQRQTFLFATTEFDQLFGPLIDRFEELDFQPYSEDELGKIMKLHADWVKFSPKVLREITGTLRGNARAAVKMAGKIARYCEIRNVSTIDEKHWDEIRKVNNIKPHGLTNGEVEILRILKDRGDCTLTMLAAATGQSRKAIQGSIELYLLRKGFMQIDTKRKITAEGSEVLNLIDG